MVSPDKISPAYPNTAFIDLNRRLNIGAYKITARKLMRFHKIKEADRPEGLSLREAQSLENKELRYEDVQAFCRAKGISDCPDVKAFNRMVLDISLQDPKEILQKWVRLYSQVDDPWESPLATPHEASLGRSNDLIQLALELNQTDSFEEFAKKLDLKPTDGLRRFYQHRRMALLNFVKAVLESPYREKELGLMPQALLKKEFQYLGTQYKSDPNSQDTDEQELISNERRAALDLLNDLPQMDLDLLEVLSRNMSPEVFSHFTVEYGDHISRISQRSPSARDRVSKLFQELSSQTGHTQHWRSLGPSLRPDELRFLMGMAKSSGQPGAATVHLGELIETWATITPSKYNPSLRELAREIRSFHSEWMATLDDGHFLLAAKLLTYDASPFLQRASKLVHSNIPPSQKLGAFKIALCLFNSLDSSQKDEVYALFETLLSEPTSSNKDSGTYELSGIPLDVLKIVTELGPSLSGEAQARLRATIEKKLQEVKGGKKVSELEVGQILFLPHLVSAAMKLGARFEDVGEDYAEIEPRLRGFMTHDMPSGLENFNRYLSETGFLGDGDGLEETLEGDKKILSSLGLTSRQIARPLTVIHEYSKELPIPQAFDIRVNNRVYHVKPLAPPSGQGCPFFDLPENFAIDVLITDAETGDTFFLASILAHLISEHGFFEGKNAGAWGGSEEGKKEFYSYRVRPERLVEFFHLKKGEALQVEILR